MRFKNDFYVIFKLKNNKIKCDLKLNNIFVLCYI